MRRIGPLRAATLPDLIVWAREHPTAARISPGTVNKLLGAVQAIAIWGRSNGLVPDDIPWVDPFSNMRVDVGEPDREPWEIDELQLLFSSPVFTEGQRPNGGT